MRSLKKVFQSSGGGWLAGLLWGRLWGGVSTDGRLEARSLAVLYVPASVDFWAELARSVLVRMNDGDGVGEPMVARGRKALLVRWEREKGEADIDEAPEQQRAAMLVGGRPTTNVRRPGMADEAVNRPKL